MTPQGAVAVGIGTLLATDTALAALVGTDTDGNVKVWGDVAPVENDLPYCFFQLQAGNGPEFSLSQEIMDDLLFLVKGVSTDAVVADQIAARARVLMKDPTMTLGDGWTLKYCRPERGINMQEPNGGTVFYHVGTMFRIKVFPA
jgi:hypothetical protein